VEYHFCMGTGGITKAVDSPGEHRTRNAYGGL
jgi:hypothetical protein